MCLFNATVRVRDLFGRNKKYIDCWKVVGKGASSRTKNNIYPIFYQTNKKYPLGEIYKSNREDKRINNKDDSFSRSSIHRGIHVFYDNKKACNYLKEGELLIKVKCLRKDYVGHNNENGQAVFMAVEFPKTLLNAMTYKDIITKEIVNE
jgi:hypothetical protein